MKPTKFSGILKYKQITKSRPDDQTLWWLTKKNFPNNELYRPTDHWVKIQEKEKRDKNLDQEGDGDTSGNWWTQNGLKSPWYHIYQPLRSGRIWHKVNF